MRHLCLALLAVAAHGQGTPVATGTWVPISMHGGPGQIVAFDKTTYVSSIDAHCIFGAYHQPLTSERNNELWCWSYSENRSFMLSHAGSFHTEHFSGMGHQVGVQIYVPELDSIFYMSDGSGSNSQELQFGHWWQYDVAGRAQRDRSISGSNARPWLSATTPTNSMAYDTVNRKGFLFPDHNGNGQEWDPTTNVWTQAGTIGKPPALNFHAMAFNPDNALVYLFGGTSGGADNADLYTYSLVTHTWAGPLVTTCTGAACLSNKPPVRQAAFLAYSTTNQLFLMGGGVVTLGSGVAFTDTWTFNPATLAWTQLSPAASYPNGGNLNNVHERCQYDSTNNVFVLMVEGAGPTPYADGTWTPYYSKIYVYAISAPLNYGRTVTTYSPTAGSANMVAPTATSNSSLGTQSYSKYPTLAVSGSTVYLGDAEALSYFDTTTCGASFHPFVRSTPNNGTWTNLGANCQAIASENSGVTDGGYDLRLAVIGGVLWECDEHWNGGVLLQAAAYCKSWNGTAWSGGPVGCFLTGGCTTGNGNTQRPEALIAVGSTPTVAVVENDHTSSFVGAQYLNIAQYSASAGVWSRLGGVKLNNNTGVGSRALGADLATDGTNIWACWNEEVDDTGNRYIVTTNAQLLCKKWDGASWSAILSGATLNQSSSSWAGRPAVTYLSPNLYVAWTERSTTGNPLMYVGQWNGSAFSLLGATYINIAAGGWAADPTVFNDGANVYVGWTEQATLGSHALGHMKKWNGSAWLTVGSAFAADTLNGSLQGLHCALAGTSPTCTFAELKYGNLPQSYVMQYNGTSWTTTLGSVGPAITTTSPLTSGNRTIAYSQAIAATGTPATFSCTITLGALPAGLALSNAANGCLVSGTPTLVGTQAFTVNVSNGVSPDASKAFSLAINDICLITTSSLPGGTINIAYSSTVATSGCASPAFSLTGSVPSGYSINATTGVISGTTATPGNYFINAVVADANAVPNPVTQPLVLVIGPPPQPKGTASGGTGSGVVR